MPARESSQLRKNTYGSLRLPRKETRTNTGFKKMKYVLSTVDKKILKVLLNPDGLVSSLYLSKKLGIPHATIQRRRKRLEKELLKFTYSVDLEKFGWRRADLFISTRNGKTPSVAKKLLSTDIVTYVRRTIGEHTIDLRAEIIIKDNAELLDMLEKVKSIDGVSDAIWSEVVQVVGRKRSIPSWIIDRL
jgi:DNA-binding Lrp family transcriptional regulator